MREENGRLIYEDTDGLLDLPLPRLPGRHQYNNAAAAIATLRRLDLDLLVEAYEKGMVQAQWPARLQHLTKARCRRLAPERCRHLARRRP